MTWADIKEWLQLLNLVLIPGVWWAATLTAKVDRLHKMASKVQAHSSKIAVLEERTGGAIVVNGEST